MKSLLLFVSFLICANRIFADPRLPVNMPFHITIRITGAYELGDYYDKSSIIDTQKLVHFYQFDLDTAKMRFRYHEDTLFFQCNNIHSNLPLAIDTAEILFDTSTHTISSLFLSYHENWQESDGSNFLNWAIWCRGLLYNVDSIVSTESISTSNSKILYDKEEHWTKIGNTNTTTEFLHGELAIGGALSDVALHRGTASSSLSVTKKGDMLSCGFAAADHDRGIEIYDQLGIKTEAGSIVAGATETLMPMPRPGLYFIRLGDSFAKIFISY